MSRGLNSETQTSKSRKSRACWAHFRRRRSVPDCQGAARANRFTLGHRERDPRPDRRTNENRSGKPDRQLGKHDVCEMAVSAHRIGAVTILVSSKQPQTAAVLTAQHSAGGYFARLAF
jgi:hypothetical protein